MDIYFQNGASADIRDLNSYEEEVLKLLLKLLPDDLRNVQVIKYILDQSVQKHEDRYNRTAKISLKFKSPDQMVTEYFSNCNICLDS